MALQTQLIEVPMVGTLAEDTDSVVLAPGSWLRLDNVQIDKAGVWKKRPGFGFLGYPTTLAPSAPVTMRAEDYRLPFVDPVYFEVPYSVFTVGPSLFACVVNLGQLPTPPVVAAWSASTNNLTEAPYAWEAKDDVPPFVISRTTEVRSSRELAGGACVELDGILWTAYKVADPSRPKVYLRGVDLATGAVVQDDVYFFTLVSQAATFALIAVGELVTAVYLTEPVA